MTRNWWLKVLCVGATLALLAASGCTGTDFLSNGNVKVSIEVVTEGSTDERYDCTFWTIAGLNIRPLDGVCSGGPSDGEPCFNDTGCAPGTCEGAQAQEVVGENGFFIVTGPKGNLQEGNCEATLASGFGSCTWECAPNAGNPPCEIFPKECNLNDPSPEATCNPLIVDPNDNPNVCVPRFLFEANAGTFAPPEPMILSAGLYEIVNLRVGPAGFYTDFPPDGAEPVLNWCGDATAVQDQFDEDDLRFFAVDGQTNVLRLVVHVDALEDALTGDQGCNEFMAAIPDILELVSVP